MKPKWDVISKYMSLDNPSFLPFKLHVYVYKEFFLFSATTYEWAVSSLLCGCVGESG